jgi:hypothetical protein
MVVSIQLREFSAHHNLANLFDTVTAAFKHVLKITVSGGKDDGMGPLKRRSQSAYLELLHDSCVFYMLPLHL